ncbi:nucleic-acid-binding protein from transposon X-element [Trichonephila clavipes]|nr:nucleic-acid-binding protein from transposon X-element [Trichonephila clavipes]
MPLFLVKKNEENKQIFQITNIGFFRVVIEPLKGSSMPPNCYRCQEIYHHSRLCNRAPKCLKCSGSHLTADCKKSMKSPAKCANCGGPHPANFSGCPTSAIDIIAPHTPDTPTHFNNNAPSTVIDIGFAANFSHSNVFTVNELSSDHKPVIFDFVTNCRLPPLLQTLKTTNWIKFQEILHYNMPVNPTIENLDQAVQNFSNMVSDAINTSTSTRISKTSHLRLPINIRELIKTKNRFRKLWNNTRYPFIKGK